MVAPDPLPDGEIWLDVGNAIRRGVIDEHGGGAESSSSAGLVLGQYADCIEPVVRSKAKITIVLHTRPDLDALFSAWLVIGLTQGRLQQEDQELPVLAEVISRSDQGHSASSDIETNWPVLFRLNQNQHEVDDLGLVRTGFELLEKTWSALKSGKNLEQIAADELYPRVGTMITEAKARYRKDREQSQEFRTSLISRSYRLREGVNEAMPVTPADISEAALVDTRAIWFTDPGSPLLKELARGEGFQLLGVSRIVESPATEAGPRHQHIISTTRGSGTCLAGLGYLLEEAEQRKEEMLQIPLPPERKRLPPGTGRHGYNVPSPWYDGRGHAFTIVDSPSYQTASGHIEYSHLTIEEVMQILLQYPESVHEEISS